MMIQTLRLILRPWQLEDFFLFAQMTADPRVMEYFPSILTTEESNALTSRLAKQVDENGWGFWAVSAPGTSDFIGFIGLAPIHPPIPFTPAIEIGWRLAYPYWGKGFAPEGALAALKYGFENLQLDEIVAFTTVSNQRSRRVMEKLGMHHSLTYCFEHPRIEPGHPLRPHVLYRIQKNECQVTSYSPSKLQ